MNWHRLTIEKTFEQFGSAAAGLSPDTAEARLKEHGPNLLEEKKKKTPFAILLAQFKDLMILILLIAAVISGILGDLTDTIVILVIVILNAFVGFIQEYRAEKAMQALQQLASTNTRVLRGGQRSELPAAQLVPGDVVLLEAGDAVPADLRVIESVNLMIEEAALTGESQGVEKVTAPLEAEQLSPGDQKNMAFKGTYVTRGHGRGLVVATGMQTELGRIAQLLDEAEPATPLQQRLTAFSKKLAAVVLFLCMIFFATGWLRGENLVKMVLTSLSLAVAAVPEALPAIITIALALAAKRMIRVKSLIRKLPAVETLGSVTCICTDKTGTLTKNKMYVERVFAGKRFLGKEEIREYLNEPAIQLQVLAFRLNNDSVQDEKGTFKGDGTELALLELAQAMEPDQKPVPRLGEIPFDAERKLMTTFHAWQEHFISLTKGAPDVILQRCTDVHKEALTEKVDEMAADGQRVLGFAYREWDKLPDQVDSEHCETNMRFLGFAGLIDPPREEIVEAIRICKEAGIITVMITGDHPVTAKTIARRVGIISTDKELVVTGKQLSAFNEETFLEKVEKIRVYARVSPEQKLQIVKTLQQKGHIVAMTGDGVNDAPSLRRADIGIAMGITGTDVSKEAADMILLDDNFSTIVKAVREGRRVYDNILKFIMYLMTSNSGELWTLLLGPLIGLPIALLPIHILWINLVSDGLPALALSFEKAEQDIMRRPPRPPQQSIFDEGRGIRIVWVGLLMAGITLSAQAWAIRLGLHWQTIVFNVLCLSQMGNVLAVRSEKQSLFRIGLFSNKFLLASVLIAFLLQAALTYIPFLQAVFHTQALSIQEFLLVTVASSLVFFVIEIHKAIKQRPGR